MASHTRISLGPRGLAIFYGFCGKKWRADLAFYPETYAKYIRLDQLILDLHVLQNARKMGRLRAPLQLVDPV